MIVVFAPHPDDETLGCGGTIMKRISEGCEVIIVVLTDGRYAFLEAFGIESNPTPKELKHIRRSEVVRATDILGVSKENLLFLNYEDGTLADYEKEAEERIIEILKNAHPDEIYIPYEKDYNVDHRAANQLILNATKKTNLSTSKYQYSITHKYDRIGPHIDALFDLFKHNLIHVDISKFLPQKKAAIREFRSQITVISYEQKRPVITRIERYQKSKETFLI